MTTTQGATPHRVSAPARGFAMSSAWFDWLESLFFLWVGDALDLIWHTINGIERSTAALLRPTHLILARGATLVITRPLRGALARSEG